MIRLLLVDDHAMMRDGMHALLSKEPDIEIVGMAGDGREAIELLDNQTPDVIVMDIGMPNLNGIDGARIITRDFPNVRIVALSMHRDKRFVMAMLEAGASGYVAKDSIASELLRAIRAVHSGQKYLSSDVAGSVIENATTRQSPVAGISTASLAPREREVLQLIAEGMTSGEVANMLNLSVHTVDTHRKNIMKKTGIHSVAELTKFALREGITTL